VQDPVERQKFLSSRAGKRLLGLERALGFLVEDQVLVEVLLIVNLHVLLRCGRRVAVPEHLLDQGTEHRVLLHVEDLVDESAATLVSHFVQIELVNVLSLVALVHVDRKVDLQDHNA